MNVLAKLPGLATPLIVLPAANVALGTSGYGQLLSILAIGTAASIVFGGVSTTVRRWISQLTSTGGRMDEAAAFWTAIVVATAAAAISSLIVSTLVLLLHASPTWWIVALFPIVAGFLNIFDNVRAAYNEHYVTAALQVVCQTVSLLAVLTFGLPAGEPIVAALALTVPYALASLLTLWLLLWQRPYLISYQYSLRLRKFTSEASVATASDGTVGLVANAVLFMLPVMGASEVAAWFGTAYRLFGALLSPVMLILLPVSTYVGTRWWTWSAPRRIHLARLFAAAGLSYGMAVSSALATLGFIYMRHSFGLQVAWHEHAIICFLFLGILSHKTYVLLVQSFESPHLLAIGTLAGAVLSSGVFIASSVQFGALVGLQAFCLALGSALVAVVVTDNLRLLRNLKREN